MSTSAIRLLVVDDEPPIRRLLRTGLASQGYEVLEAGTGREAEHLLPSGPELVILDLGLPDVTGQELLRRWRAGGNDVPVLILSSRTDEAGLVEALELGADDYLTKQRVALAASSKKCRPRATLSPATTAAAFG